MISFAPKSYSKRLLPIISWSHWFTFFNVIAAIILSIFYMIADGKPDTALGKFYLFTNWLSHMGFLTFMAYVLILFPIILILPKTRFIRATASIVFTAGLSLLLLDAYIYSELGYHLNASSSSQITELITGQINQNTQVFWLVSIISIVAILTFELVVSNYAWKHLRSLQKTNFSHYVTSTLVGAFFLSHFIHIWADANLEYDILRQDTTFPLSYPTTAKTLLTKYGMFDRNAYLERRVSPLTLNVPVPTYPEISQECVNNSAANNSTFIILTANDYKVTQQTNAITRTQQNYLQLNRHIDNALPSDSWFNLFYSLPSIYKSELLSRKEEPLLIQLINKKGMAKSLTEIGTKEELNITAPWLFTLFDKQPVLQDISSLIFSNKLNQYPNGLHVIYFNAGMEYQFELFIDALLLAQNQKEIKDNIWISSLGNLNAKSTYASKPAVLVLPDSESKTIEELTSHMDVQHTLLKHWLACKVDRSTYSNGKDLLRVKRNRVFANTMKDGIMVFSKDKSIFVDQTGSFQSYSSQLESPITVSSDLPLMIDGVNFIKQFSQNMNTTPKAE